MDTRDELIEALRTHNWFYPMSDDHGVWTRGQDQWERIQSLASKVADGQELIAKYRKPIH